MDCAAYSLDRRHLLAVGLCLSVLLPGCAFGPKSILRSRTKYNEVVKATSEQQLLLNIVRLRYVDTPSSLEISAIADQREITAGLSAVPFFTSAAAGNFGTYRGSVLPEAQLNGSERPTFSYTPMDDEQFTRRLFTPITLEGAAYLSKTTWPISTVFRLYLENLNWVSNAEIASGPTPVQPPVYAEFLQGVLALQRLQDRSVVTLFIEDREEVVSKSPTTTKPTASDLIESAQHDLSVKSAEGETQIVKQKKQTVLRVGNIDDDDMDWQIFCNSFKIDPRLRTLDLTTEKLDPFLKDTPIEGLGQLDLETRSLLQVLFFVSHGVSVPREHQVCGVAPVTRNYDGTLFDWQQVLGGLFEVKSVQSKKPPPCAHLAVQYKDYWFYIDERDRESKATFALLLEVSRLELQPDRTQAPILTLGLGK